jgi:signal transduction histidine kinase
MGALTLSERRGAFVSAVTHELRTPLTTLRMYTEMLAEGMIRDDDKRRSYLATLRAEADRLGHLVENVLAYSRIERGRARGHIVTVPLNELIDRVRQRLSERAEQAGMQLLVEPAEGDGRIVRADPSAVEQILFNLVDNACKYAASAADRTIHLDADGRNGQALIRVRDHGPGISLQDGRRLFRPFCKSAHDAANSAPGVGLGLALSRRLAREMGGDLCLDERPGDGAAFVLTLPT